VANLFVREIYRLHGLPEVLVSDRDPRFTGIFWQALWRILGTKLRMSAPYHLQTDGQTERANRTLEEILRAYVRSNLRRTDTAGAKLRERFAGPFQIIEVIGPNAYRLDLPPLWKVHPVQNITNLRLYWDPTVDFPSRPPAPPPPRRAAEDGPVKTWEPESLVSKRRVTANNGRQHWEVKVHWKNCTDEVDSWEPFECFNPAALRWIKRLLPKLPLDEDEATKSPPVRRSRRRTAS
jgi:hypothetical protein